MTSPDSQGTVKVRDRPMDTQVDARWDAFVSANANRRAIRDFDGRSLPDETVRELLEQAILAPSSINLQSYQLHWLRDPQIKTAVAEACNKQPGAMSAATLVVVTADLRYANASAEAMAQYVEATDQLDDKSKRYHLDVIKRAKRAFRVVPLVIWSPLKALFSTFLPPLTLMPLGPSGMRHWAARNSIFAAQTLLLAASARGVDSCPMEGFNAQKVAKLLKLPYGVVIPVVIALGYRSDHARVEPRWRRSFEQAVVVR